ncbi:hypothetical protein N7528_007095 [Penicillium herquei]|nr:hypothetical protein N7528_007095 [Penicillium herquei]
MSSELERRDDQNIFSELDDPERRAAVTELLRDFPTMRLVSRHGFWEMWFHDVPQIKKAIWSMKWAKSEQERHKLMPGPRHTMNPPSYTECEEFDTFGLRAPVRADKRFLQASESSITTSSQRIAMERDKNQCILSKNNSNPVFATHIFPLRVEKIKRGYLNESYTYMWSRLECEFGEKRVQHWRNAIMDRTVLCQKTIGDLEETDFADYADRPDNIITLSKEVWRYWQDDLCVFRPVSLSEDKKSMELAFHWLPLPKEGTRYSQLDPLKLRYHPHPDKRLGYDDGPGNGIHLYHAETNKMICSGHIFTIRTENPETHPLPSMELLDMQWMLKRSSRLRGDLVQWRHWPVEKRSRRFGPVISDERYCWLYRGKVWSYRHSTWMYKEDLEDEGDDENTEKNCRRTEWHYLSEDEDADEYESQDEFDSSFNFLAHEKDWMLKDQLCLIHIILGLFLLAMP